jgi:hypothetical protein
MNNMKDTLKQILILVGFFLVVFVLIFVFAGKGNTNTDKNYDTFAQCLTDKGAVMYGAEWCAHCKEQKETFGASFKHIKYVECPDNTKLCLDKGIDGYPTWLFGTSTKKVEGFDKNTTMQELSDATGCVLP